MKIKIITCSGTNEHTSIENLISLLAEFPVAEIGIQSSGEKCFYGSPRYNWIMQLHAALLRKKRIINAALHLNKDWVENFCCGIIANELKEILSLQNHDGSHFIKRIQLNFKIGREKTPDKDILLAVMAQFADHKFILSYNDSNAELINEIYRQGMEFDNLYDSSFGTGQSPDKREAPPFKNILQGYAGGLSPDNIYDELDKIAANIPPSTGIYIDAQGKLEDENGRLSIEKCRSFIINALRWQKDHLHANLPD